MIFIVHNRYRSEFPSGENRVVECEITDLRDAGVEVLTYLRSSDEIADMGPWARAKLPLAPIQGTEAVHDIGILIKQFRPDIMHVHNLYPLISPAVTDVAYDAGVPVVHTVHNYRHVCVKGTFFRDGAPCESCRGRTYRGRRYCMAAIEIPARRAQSWRQPFVPIDVGGSRLSLFVAVSEFVAEHLVQEGIPSDRVVVQPNPVPDPGDPSPPGGGVPLRRSSRRRERDHAVTRCLGGGADERPSRGCRRRPPERACKAARRTLERCGGTRSDGQH